MKEVDNLIIGGGLSAIPLLKELDRTGDDYVIINEGKPVWDELEAANRLDFDLVSSLYTSYFSFELVNIMRSDGNLGDRYPTSSEYYEFLKKYRKIYAPKTIQLKVNKIENHASYSTVYLSDGTQYKANNVIIATAFKRKIHNSLQQFSFDESLKGKTVAVTSIGDSANLLIAKLVCFGAKVELISNGFIALDKLFHIPAYISKTNVATLDQFEFHNIAKHFPTVYDGVISAGYFQSFLLSGKLSAFFYGPNFSQRHPLSVRKEFRKSLWKSLLNIYLRWIPFVTTSKFPDNSNIALKYWPIDFYKFSHLHDLENSIRKGFLLNDLPFFIEHGHVSLWEKSSTIINKETKELSYGEGEDIATYDFIIEGDRETPALPEIVYKNASGDFESFNYEYRSLFMGVIPPELKNIYLLGYTRPFTGGLNNITEMQSIFVHKIITQQNFCNTIHTNISQKIRKYNKRHYLSPSKLPSDHLVYYGFYTDEIGELMGIQPKLWDVRSFEDLAKYFLFPNNAFYYREQGEYAISGVKELADKITDEHYNFVSNLFMFGPYILVFWNIIMTILLLPFSWPINLGIAIMFIIPIHLIASLINGNWMFPSNGRKSPFSIYFVLLAGLILGSIFGEFLIPLTTVITALGIVQFYRTKKKNRHIFNDMDSKRSQEALTFFEKYRNTFLKVMRDKNSDTIKSEEKIAEIVK